MTKLSAFQSCLFCMWLNNEHDDDRGDRYCCRNERGQSTMVAITKKKKINNLLRKAPQLFLNFTFT